MYDRKVKPSRMTNKINSGLGLSKKFSRLFLSKKNKSFVR